jgi:hypothetical protein
MAASEMLNSTEPDCYDEAIRNDHKDEWQEAMQDEMQSHRENQTWELVDLPASKKTIPCTWDGQRLRSKERNWL